MSRISDPALDFDGAILRERMVRIKKTVTKKVPIKILPGQTILEEQNAMTEARERYREYLREMKQ